MNHANTHNATNSYILASSFSLEKNILCNVVALRPHPSMLHHAPSEGSAPSLGSIDEWLKIIGLDQYRENFNSAGYCSLESVIPMSHEWASQHITHLITHPDELEDDTSLTNIPCAALLQGSGQNGNLMQCTSEEDPEQRAGFIVWNASKTGHKDSCLICDEGKKTMHHVG